VQGFIRRSLPPYTDKIPGFTEKLKLFCTKIPVEVFSAADSLLSLPPEQLKIALCPATFQISNK
jgi:hypothetical protein